MKDFEIYLPEINYRFPMVFVKAKTFSFGVNEKVSICPGDFYISKYPVTQKLWEYIMGTNPSHFTGLHKPVENVSFNDVTNRNGFLNKLNSAAGSQYKLNYNIVFRLPSETEWEYAARGGTHCTEELLYSGSNDLDSVGWYEENSGSITDINELHQIKNQRKKTQTHDVGLKMPNQLDIFDMCGNVWEWCGDYFQPDIRIIPKDGMPYLKETNERVLRGGCHHNWAIHCTVSKRYAISPDAKDECIGFRIAAAAPVKR
jgi:sulfatase modifying factor 1